MSGRFFRRADILVILVLLLASAGIWAGYRLTHRGKPAKAEIYYYSQLVETVDLSRAQERTFTLPQDENVVFRVFADGSIRFESSDCPDKICVRTGKISMVGQSAACLPNGFVIKIVGRRSPGDPDIIIGR